MAEIFIGIGSNLGDKEKNIRKAIYLVSEKCRILEISSLYETEPVGFKGQDLFLNCALQAETSLSQGELLEFVLSIEKKLGRLRTIKNGPRTIDLDILFYGNEIIKEDNLIVPHPRLHERLFVLEPLNEICPNFIHPAFGRSIEDLHSDADKSKSVKLLKKFERSE